MVRNGRDLKRKQRQKSGLSRRFIRGPYLLTTIPLSESPFHLRAITWPRTGSVVLSLFSLLFPLFLFSFIFPPPFFSYFFHSFITMSRVNRGTKRGGRREGRGRLSTTGLVESLNHGVVQWLQGRRKPRVGCAGQNGPSSAGILSPVQHTPSVVLFFVVVRLEE